MIGMVLIFVLLTLVIALVYGAWSSSSKEERSLVLKALGKGALFASIAFAILFVIVNVF